jgi:hypothetical protein
MAYRLSVFGVIIIVGLIIMPSLVYSCESCRVGNPDSPLTAGMNVAIITLLIITKAILGGFVLFFLNLRKRAKMYALDKDSSLVDDGS